MGQVEIATKRIGRCREENMKRVVCHCRDTLQDARNDQNTRIKQAQSTNTPGEYYVIAEDTKKDDDVKPEKEYIYGVVRKEQGWGDARRGSIFRSWVKYDVAFR